MFFSRAPGVSLSRAPGDLYLGRLDMFCLGREGDATYYTLFPLLEFTYLSLSDILGPYFLGPLLEICLRFLADITSAGTCHSLLDDNDNDDEDDDDDDDDDDYDNQKTTCGKTNKRLSH